jgi:hypothetical protein
MTEITIVELDFKQRRRAVALENSVGDDEYATAAEIIWLRDRVSDLEKQVISGFYEEEIPQFRQGCPRHELEELVTAEEVQHYVDRITKLLRTRK